MGQRQKRIAAKRTASAGVQLDELDYLRLTQKASKVDAAMMRGQKAVQDAAAAADKDVEAARAEFVATLGAMGEKYAFNADASHRFDDANFRLIPIEKP